MKKIIAFCIIAIAVTGCGKVDRMKASFTGDAAKTCVDGVLYLQFTSGATVAYNKDGTVRQCGG